MLAVPTGLAREPTTAAPLEGDDVIEGVVEGVPMTFSVGLEGGLPVYRNASAVGAIRTVVSCVAARVDYGTVGVSSGAQLRLYPPLTLPLPAYVGVGLDVYFGNTVPPRARAHVPLGRRVRLDLEGGVARSSTLLGTLWSPYASIDRRLRRLPDHGRPVDRARGADPASGRGAA